MDAMSTPKAFGISFVMPVRNEERYLSRAVESVLSQRHDGGQELILAVAPSFDSTEVIIADLKRHYKSKLVVLRNSDLVSASGLNLAIAAAKFDLVIRVDAHSMLSEDYAALAQGILRDSGAANVGGMMIAEGESNFQKAVAHCYNNRIGLGGGAFHLGGTAGPVETVYLGCFQKSWLEKVGGFDPKWVRGQDWELNKRIREAGGIVWFDPRLKVKYYPRNNWWALAKQFFKTGVWRGALTRSAPGQSAIRYWIPPLLVLSTILVLPVFLYLLTIALAAWGATGLNPASRLWLIFVLPTMHYAWGIGFWWGLAGGAR